MKTDNNYKKWLLPKEKKLMTLETKDLKFEEPQFLKRARLEKIYGRLPSNYFDLSSSEQFELNCSRILQRVELSATKPEPEPEPEPEAKPEPETSFIQNVFGILCLILILWIISQAPDVGYGGPLRR
jgi:hypothetical protein